jgi:4-amino-4-deoxychorismate lyase
MYPLLETIRFEKGTFGNSHYHVRRMMQSAEQYFGRRLEFDPVKVLHKAQLLMSGKTGLFKFRLLYNISSYQQEFIPYRLPEIKTLKLVTDDEIEYGCKYSDRSALNKLREQRGHADDVLIVKNGMVTDTSFANILFYDGSEWLTPKHPLLPGTRRAFLLDSGVISEAIIKPVDLPAFRQAVIINAMIRFEDMQKVKVIAT